MMNNENIDPQLWTLLNTKEYDVLSKEEKSFVAAFMDESGYQQWQKINKLAGETYGHEFETYEFDAVKSKRLLDKKFEVQKTPVLPLISRNIPLWQAAAMWAFLLLASGWYFIRLKEPKEALPVLAKIDTVFVPVASLPLHDTVYLKIKEADNKMKPVKDHVNFPEKLIEKDEEYLLLINREINISDYKNTAPKGQSMDEDTVSGKFMMGVL